MNLFLESVYGVVYDFMIDVVVYVEMLATRITSLIFSPSCDELVAGCWDGTVHSFRSEPFLILA